MCRQNGSNGALNLVVQRDMHVVVSLNIQLNKQN